MEKEQVVKQLEGAIESIETGKWTFPDLTKAILIAFKYLVEKASVQG